MKKYILISCALCVSLVAFGQMEVYSNGVVVVNPSGAPPAIPPYHFCVNSDYQNGISVNTTPTISSMKIFSYNGISSSITHSPAASPLGQVYIAGVKGYSSLTGGSSSAISFGVIGNGVGSSEGRNIGVFGYVKPPGQTIPGTPPVYGVGVFGAADFNSSALNFTKAYAGYFVGDVNVAGSLYMNGQLVSTSDARYKQNIADLRQTETYRNVLRLNPVEYNLVQRYTEYTDSAGNLAQLGVFDEESQLFQKKHYGLIAQELREVYPDLVYEDGDGYLGVDYIGIIPLLISSVKEQNITIKELNEKIVVLERKLNSDAVQNNAPAKPQQETTGETVAALYQNTPNPFNENTEIAFYLPQSVTNAMLCVYDMNGRQLSQNIITQRGSSVFVVNGNQYGAGMYLYSLIADNQIVDTKRMILTK